MERNKRDGSPEGRPWGAKVKTTSSKRLKTQARTLRSFHWQNGYGDFSVSRAEVDAVAAYIEGQEQHHLW